MHKQLVKALCALFSFVLCIIALSTHFMFLAPCSVNVKQKSRAECGAGDVGLNLLLLRRDVVYVFYSAIFECKLLLKLHTKFTRAYTCHVSKGG